MTLSKIVYLIIMQLFIKKNVSKIETIIFIANEV